MIRTGLALAALAALPAIAAAPPPRPLYTEAQAAEGAALYQASCAMCHGDTLAGTFDVPSLDGRFVAHWAGARADVLADYIQQAMPLFAPGSLSAEDNARITAYLLKANGFPAGTTPLPTDMAALRALTIVPPPAPVTPPMSASPAAAPAGGDIPARR